MSEITKKTKQNVHQKMCDVFGQLPFFRCDMCHCVIFLNKKGEERKLHDHLGSMQTLHTTDMTGSVAYAFS